MPIWRGEARRRRERERGFTLVELIVVITIIGVMVGAVVLAIPDASGGLRVEAERFAARAKAAQEQAVIESRSTSLRVDASGYAVARSQDGTWRETVRFPWETGTQPDFGTGPGGRTTFDATGLADPLEVNLRRGDDRVQVVIRSDGDIDVRR